MYKRKFHVELDFKLPVYTWDKDRKLCQRCKYYKPVETGQTKEKKSISMTCMASNRKSIFGGTSCIDERTSGICGPKGKLFAKK
jgi:hypothetical protein